MKRRSKPCLTVDQIRQGCALMGWTTRDLAARAGIKGGNRGEPAIARMRAAFEAAGIEFVSDELGEDVVRMRKE